jgi:hypothetical protein
VAAADNADVLRALGEAPEPPEAMAPVGGVAAVAVAVAGSVG